MYKETTTGSNINFICLIKNQYLIYTFWNWNLTSTAENLNKTFSFISLMFTIKIIALLYQRTFREWKKLYKKFTFLFCINSATSCDFKILYQPSCYMHRRAKNVNANHINTETFQAPPFDFINIKASVRTFYFLTVQSSVFVLKAFI